VVTRTEKTANWRGGMRPPSHDTRGPSTATRHPCTASGTSSSSCCGTVSVNPVIGALCSFSAVKATRTVVPGGIVSGSTGTCAAAAGATTSAAAAQARGRRTRGRLQPEVAGDHHPLDLVGALADLEDLLVAV